MLVQSQAVIESKQGNETVCASISLTCLLCPYVLCRGSGPPCKPMQENMFVTIFSEWVLPPCLLGPLTLVDRLVLRKQLPFQTWKLEVCGPGELLVGGLIVQPVGCCDAGFVIFQTLCLSGAGGAGCDGTWASVDSPAANSQAVWSHFSVPAQVSTGGGALD